LKSWHFAVAGNRLGLVGEVMQKLTQNASIADVRTARLNLLEKLVKQPTLNKNSSCTIPAIMKALFLLDPCFGTVYGITYRQLRYCSPDCISEVTEERAPFFLLPVKGSRAKLPTVESTNRRFASFWGLGEFNRRLAASSREGEERPESARGVQRGYGATEKFLLIDI
jgi:hypothetical protein